MSLGPQCLQCKKRRVKCGSEEPHCRKCAKDGYNCPGYTKGLKWVEVQPRSRRKANASLAKAETTTPRPWKSPSSSEESPDSEVQMVSRDQPPGLDYMLPSLDKRLAILADALTYFDTVMSPDLSAIVWQTRNQFTMREWVRTPELIQNMLICCVIGTQVLKSGTDSNAALYSYRGQVIHDMGKYLRRTSEQSPAMSLATITSIMQQEVHLSPISGYKVHFDAARRMVEICGGIRKWTKHWPNSFELMTAFVQTDVMSSTTTHVKDLALDRIRSQQDYTDAVPNFQALLLDSPCPCPLALYETIIQINELRITPRRKMEDLIAWNTSFTTILQSIHTFSPWLWAKTLSCLPQEDTSSDKDIVDAANEWATLACCYQSAIVIYLIDSTTTTSTSSSSSPSSSTSSSPADTTTSTTALYNNLATKALHQLHSDLTYLFTSYPNQKATPEKPTLWRFVTWPMMVYTYKTTVLGTGESTHSRLLPNSLDNGEGDKLYDELRRIGAILGSHSITDGARMFEEMAKTGAVLGWDETFRRSCIFYL